MADPAAPDHRLSLAGLRRDYTRAALDERSCDSNPILQFERWLKDAQTAELKEPNAMALATCNAGRPSARIVLLKEVGELGFVFYTNYTSRKAQELESNPLAALTFYWAELERQIRIEGRVSRVPREESAAYFRTRPRGSQLGAWVSHQSSPIPDRAALETRLAELETRFASLADVPAPDFWGGYRLLPDSIEFWQGRRNRLHDRLLYERQPADTWTITRLSP